jgi:hypothetical protein
LIGVLRQATAQIERHPTDDADGHAWRLVAGVGALREIIVWLQGDPEVRCGGLTRPLALVENALSDAGRGAKPPILDQPPAGKGDKPTGTMREAVQGSLAAALEVLSRARVGTGQAAEWVAAEARRVGLRSADSSAVSARQIRGWRSEINKGKGPAEARENFEAWVGEERTKPWWNAPQGRREAAQAVVKRIVGVLASAAPLAAPKRQRRERAA